MLAAKTFPTFQVAQSVSASKGNCFFVCFYSLSPSYNGKENSGLGRSHSLADGRLGDLKVHCYRNSVCLFGFGGALRLIPASCWWRVAPDASEDPSSPRQAKEHPSRAHAEFVQLYPNGWRPVDSLLRISCFSRPPLCSTQLPTQVLPSYFAWLLIPALPRKGYFSTLILICSTELRCSAATVQRERSSSQHCGSELLLMCFWKAS